MKNELTKQEILELTPQMIESLGWSLEEDLEGRSKYTYEHKGTKYGLLYSKKYPYDICIITLSIGLFDGVSSPHIRLFLVTDDPKEELGLLMKQMVMDNNLRVIS